MLELKNKEDIMISTLVIVLVVTLINCIINREILDISYFFIMLQYFIRIMKIRLSDVDEEL